MSLLRTIALRAPRAPLVTATITKKPVRFFSTSPLAQKDSGSAAKETIDSVNKAVGDAAVKGIEKGQQASESIKSSVGLNAKSAEGSAKELSGEAKGKASEVQGKASGMAGEAQGKASELMGEAKGKGQEVAGQAKGKAEEIKGKM